MYRRLFKQLVWIMSGLVLCIVLPCQARADDIMVSEWYEMQGALFNASSGATIVLANDIEAHDYAGLECPLADYPRIVQAAAGVKVPCTLDLNGHTLTLNISPSEVYESAGVAVLPGGDLRIMNGTLTVHAPFALLNTGGKLTVENLTVYGDSVALMDYGDAYTEIISGVFSGKTGVGYYNMGQEMWIHAGSYEGRRCGYLGGPFPKNANILAGGFEGNEAALSNEGSDPLQQYIAPNRVVNVDDAPVLLNATTHSLQGSVRIHKEIEPITNPGKSPPDDPRPEEPYPEREIYLMQSLFTIGRTDYYIVVDGDVLWNEMDVAPYINAATNRTMMPVRYVAQSLLMDVYFDEATREVFLSRQGQVIRLTLNSTLAFRTNEPVYLESPPVVLDGRTMLPIGEIADLMGLSREDPDHFMGYLQWIPEDQGVLIQRWMMTGL